MKKFFGSLPYLFILITWFIFASPYFLKGLVPFSSTYLVSFFPPWSAAYGMPVKNNAMPDILTQIYPWKKLTIDTWKMGQIPLWNPYSFSGTPLAGNYQSAVFSPFNFLFLFFSQIDAWSILVLLQPLLAGYFMYFFLRSVDRTKAASLIGSIAFMFCGFMTVWMGYATLGYAAVWLPLVLLGIHRYIKKPNWWSLLCTSIGLGLSFVSGHFQISIYILFCAVGYLAVETIHSKQIVRGLTVLGYMGIGVLLASPQFAASFSAYSQSPRSSSFVKGEIIPWQYIVTLLAPDFYGHPVTRNDWFGHYAEWASYIGVIPLLLASYVLITKKRVVEYFFIFLAAIAILLAFPTPFSDLLFAAKISVLSTSAAARIIILFSFSFSVLAAYGWDALKRDWEKKNIAPLVILSGAAIAVLLLIWTLVVVVKVFPVDKLVIARRNFILPTVLSALAIGLFFLGHCKQKRVKQIVLIVLLLLTTFDLLRFAMKWMPFDPRSYVYPDMAVITFLQNKVGYSRIFGNVGGELTTTFAFPSIEGYDAVYQERYGEFISSANNGKVQKPERSVVAIGKQGTYTERILQLLGVRYVLHRLSDIRNIWAYPYWNYPYYTQVYRDNYYAVWENTNALPRAYLVSSYIVKNEDQKIIDTLLDPAFDARDNVVLEKNPLVTPQKGEAEIKGTQYSPNRVVFQVHTSVPKLLVLSDVYDNGWKASVDTKQTAIYRANYDFRSVPVPSGDHTIVFYFDPIGVRVGIAVSVVLLAYLCLTSFVKAFYEHRHL